MGGTVRSLGDKVCDVDCMAPGSLTSILIEPAGIVTNPRYRVRAVTPCVCSVTTYSYSSDEIHMLLYLEYTRYEREFALNHSSSQGS